MKFAKKLALVATVGALLPLSSQAALTQQQYQNVVYGGAAAVAWGSIGTINGLLLYFLSHKIPSSAANWGNVAGAVCGTVAAGLGKTWNPPTDPISKMNIALGTLKGGSVIGPATVCKWTTTAIAFAVVNAHNDADAHANALNAAQKGELDHLVKIFENQKGNLTEAIQDAEDAEKARASAQHVFDANHCNQVNSIPCIVARRNLTDAQRDARNSKIYAKQMSWDLGQTLYKISLLEKEALPRPTAARPVQIP
jgi:hypothetical protein